MALYECMVCAGKYPKISYYVDSPSNSTHQATINFLIELNNKYKNMNITIGDTAVWGDLSINSKSYTKGTYDISLIGLTSILIRNRIYANSALHTSFVINSIK